jgi:hypothetical protein
VINKAIIQVVWERGGDGERQSGEKGLEENARGRECGVVQNRPESKVKNRNE